MALTDSEVRERIEAVEELLGRIDRLPDPSRAIAQDTVQVLLELYGEALERLLARAPSAGGELATVAADDELLAHLLLLHGLHPSSVEARVRQALEDARPRLGGQGDEVVLVAIDGAEVRLRAAGGGCGSNAAARQRTLEEAILARAPEIESVRVENDASTALERFVPLTALRRGHPDGRREEPLR